MLYDVIVVGSGISGLFAALYAKRNGQNVAIVTKGQPLRSNSAVASGGINAAHLESIQSHIQDTIKGSDGLYDAQTIAQMCQEAPSIIEELIQLGVVFDSDPQGEPIRRPFGGGSVARTCYIGDHTGSAITQKLLAACKEEGIHILSNHFFMNMTFFKGALSGVTLLRRSDSEVLALACKALVLAGGGYGGIYRGFTTNDANGDVLAAALKAGMTLVNMEFVQFHPTTIKHKAILLSEAGRGEGARIVDETGNAFVDALATRDVLTRAILTHEAQGHNVFLDYTTLSQETIQTKLPQTYKSAFGSAGIDISKEPVPIEPAAHYTIGGILTKADTSTQIPGVFACGECASSGVHGANRLGGNSLLEAAFFGRKAGMHAARKANRHSFLPIDYDLIEKETRTVELIIKGENLYNVAAMRKNLGNIMFKHVGVFREEKGLLDALEYIHYLMQKSYGLHCLHKERDNNVELLSILEFHNALQVAESVVMSALARHESRGVHYRSDYPQKDDRNYNGATHIWLLNQTHMKVRFERMRSKNLLDALYKLFLKD